jgi:hypothetical protein
MLWAMGYGLWAYGLWPMSYAVDLRTSLISECLGHETQPHSPQPTAHSP